MKIFAKFFWILNMFGLIIRVRLKRFVPHIKEQSVKNNIIVSLTSYGNRVKDLLPYTLFSLLEQSLKPNRIILWLDSDHWNMDNLPTRIKLMISFGIEVRFCEDIRSYKKLIQTLNENRNSLIITVDDDQYYGQHIIEQLYKSHLEEPGSICCIIAHEPTFENGKLLPYTLWKHNIKRTNSELIFPFGAAGILYPPRILPTETLNKDVFFKICPNADDIWFWAMGLMNNAKYKLVGFNSYYLHIFPLDRFYFKDMKLTTINVNGNQNDVQLKKVFDYYNLWNKIKS